MNQHVREIVFSIFVFEYSLLGQRVERTPPQSSTHGLSGVSTLNP